MVVYKAPPATPSGFCDTGTDGSWVCQTAAVLTNPRADTEVICLPIGRWAR